MLSDKQVQHKCLAYSGATQCRYLESNNKPGSYGKFICAKLLGAKKKEKDKKVSEHLKACKAQGVNPLAQYTAIGDGNGCCGYLPLTHVRQGYDVKN